MNNDHQKIIVREDGTQYKITLRFVNYSYINLYIDFSLNFREKGKKKWKDVPDDLSNWKYRELSMEDREKHRIENMLRFVSEEEILEAQLELWAKIKPTLPIYKGKKF